MELDEILTALDRTAANLAKLERVWERAAPFIPDGPVIGCSHREYDDLSRVWQDLLAGLPPIDGWTITEGLPDIEAIGYTYVEYLEIGEAPPPSIAEWTDQPGKDLAEYRYRLNRARRRAVRGRLNHLAEFVDLALPEALDDISRQSKERMDGVVFVQLANAITEIDRLVGDTVERRGRWGDLNRHVHFGQGHDWHDILEYDWPSVRPDLEAAAFDETEALPVPNIDLGLAADGELTGTATTALPWNQLDDEAFERLLFNLLRSIPEHQNVQWLMQTQAPDRGRDLSLDRVHRDSTGTVRTERTIVQAKHWLKKSIRPHEIADTITRVKLWKPPVRCLVIATSGRFTLDAVEYIEQHNITGEAPRIEMWPDNQLEALIAQKPAIAAAHGLR